MTDEGRIPFEKKAVRSYLDNLIEYWSNLNEIAERSGKPDMIAKVRAIPPGEMRTFIDCVKGIKYNLFGGDLERCDNCKGYFHAAEECVYETAIE
jgi:hypothetical protein